MNAIVTGCEKITFKDGTVRYKVYAELPDKKIDEGTANCSTWAHHAYKFGDKIGVAFASGKYYLLEA